jgi:hypothetical protein
MHTEHFGDIIGVFGRTILKWILWWGMFLIAE